MAKAPSSPPKHRQIRNSLQELAETLRPGDRFPSHTEITKRFGVSNSTALRALDDLQRDGWILRRNGVGTFVADPADATRRPAPAAMPTIAALALSTDGFFQKCVGLLTAEGARTGRAMVCHYADNKADFADALPLEALRPDGFLIFSYRLVSVAEALRDRGHRVVVVGVPPAGETPALPCVFSDHEYGAALVTNHLLGLGHRRIAFAEVFYPILPSRRWRGHVRALRAANVADPERRIAKAEVAAWREDPDAIRRYFDRPDAPTALATWNDGEALHLYRLLRRAGLRIPEDVSIVGYDNLTTGELADPPLDTVDQHMDVQIAHAHALLESGAETAPSVIAIPTLVPRGSSAPPPLGRR